MLNKEQIQTLLEGYLKDTDYALITLEISPMNEILVEIDRLAGVDVEDCGKLNSWLVEQLDKMGEEDYALEVGSVSLSDPFKTKMQYEKHLGDDVEVLTAEGKKLRGQNQNLPMNKSHLIHKQHWPCHVFLLHYRQI